MVFADETKLRKYLLTIGETAKLARNYSHGKLDDEGFKTECKNLVKQMESVYPNQMVIDMITSWSNVLLGKMTRQSYLEKWKITEELFFTVY